MSLEKFLEFTEAQEGGWARDEHDRGGLTRYGIASASHPEVDLSTLTREGAAAIFEADYWTPCHCYEMPEPVDLVVADYAVHSGTSASLKALQRTIGTKPDGRWGNQSRAALRRSLEQRGAALVALACIRRRKRFMVRGFRLAWFSPKQPLRYLGGYMKRIIDLTFLAGSYYER